MSSKSSQLVHLIIYFIFIYLLFTEVPKMVPDT